MIGELVEVLRLETEAAKHRRDFQLEVIAVRDAKALLQLAVAVQHAPRALRRQRLVAESMLEVVHLGLHVEQRLEREAGFVDDGAAAVHAKPSCGR